MASTDARPIPKKNVAYRVTLPILDADGDLVTGATGLDSEVSIDGGTFADCTNEATEIATNSGMYYLDLTQAEMNGDTIAIIVKTSSSGAKTTPIVLYPEEAGDIRVDITMISGDAGAADAAESFFDGTGYAGTNNVIPTVTTVGSVTGNVGGNVAGSVASVAAGVTVTTNNDKTGYALSAAGIQGIWDRLTSALTTSGSIGKLLVDNIDALISSRATPAQVNTEADTALADVGLTTTITGRVDATISSRSSHTAANVRTEMDSNSTQLAAIVADTNELQVDWVNGGRLDLLIDAIKAVTDQLPQGGALTTLLNNVAAILADTGTDGVVLSAAVQNAIADAVLSRGVSNVEDTANTTSLAAIILAILESSISGTTWTIRKTGGTTFVTKTVTVDADADPITGVT